MEFGVSWVGANLYLSRRFTIKGWNGRRSPHLKNSSYRATRPGETVVTLSSGPGADRPMWSGTEYIALMASTSSGVMVEATPDGPAKSRRAAKEETGRRVEIGTALMGEGDWFSSDEESSTGLLSALRLMAKSRMRRLTWGRQSSSRRESERRESSEEEEEGRKSNSGVKVLPETLAGLLYPHFRLVTNRISPRGVLSLAPRRSASDLARDRGVASIHSRGAWPRPIAAPG